MTYIPLEQRPPAYQRSTLVFIARVHLREARARRSDRRFSHILLRWAANARRRASAIDLRPAQSVLPLSSTGRAANG